MNHPAEPPFDLDQLPIPQRLVAQALILGLDYLGARHPASWEHGRVAGLAASRLEPSSPGASKQAATLTFGYPEVVHHRPAKEQLMFNAERLALTAEIRAAMRDDCADRLPKGAQPTAEQWKAILSGSPTTLVTGVAGTGKTKTALMRCVLLHRYLGVPINQIRILTFSREARMELASDLRALFAVFDVTLTSADSLMIVKTARSTLLEQVHALPDLAGAIPLEAFSGTDGDVASLSDGRPFEPGLNARQRDEMTKCLNQLYRSNKVFAEIYQELWAAALRLPRLEVDAPEVVKRAPLGWKQSEVDTELCDSVEGLWRKAKAWPIDGITVGRRAFTLRGRTYSTHGYIPHLKAHVVLGFDRSEGRNLARNPTARMELYKEVAIKKSLFQAYFPECVIHLDSYEEATDLAAALKALGTTAPSFRYAPKGDDGQQPILDSFNITASLLDALGLEVASVAGRMNFLPDDTDALYFEALGIYWQALERQLLSLPSPVIPFGRLFTLFSDQHPDNLRHLPSDVLGQCRHMLIDGAEDQTVPVAGWLRAVLYELRRRDANQPVTAGLLSTVTLAGDISQWIYGSFGTSPRMITEFDELFPSTVPATRSVLTECFRSSQQIVDAGHNLVRNLTTGAIRVTKSVRRVEAGEALPVQMYGDDPGKLKLLCEEAARRGFKMLILINGPQDTQWVDGAVGDLIRQDRAGGGRKIRVRSYHKAKALEADVVVMVGDPSAGQSSWHRNQLFKLAGFSSGGDSTPGDTVQHGEALRLAYVAVSRTLVACHWFMTGSEEGTRTASALATLLPGLFEDRR